MDRYIHEQNLLNYRKVLSETTDPAKRQTVLKLLASELANVRTLMNAARPVSGETDSLLPVTAILVPVFVLDADFHPAPESLPA